METISTVSHSPYYHQGEKYITSTSTITTIGEEYSCIDKYFVIGFMILHPIKVLKKILNAFHKYYNP